MLFNDDYNAFCLNENLNQSLVVNLQLMTRSEERTA